MKITNWLDLLGGLALFLYGMQVLSDSLEDAAGDRLKTILEKLTNTKFKGVLVGIGVTGCCTEFFCSDCYVDWFHECQLDDIKQMYLGCNGF